jgi:hypothetical protein
MTADWPFGNYSLLIGDSANTGMTIGLTINQGANTDEIFALKHSAVAHGCTDLAETDTFAMYKNAAAGADGGVIRFSFSGSTYPVIEDVFQTACSTGFNTSAIGAFQIRSQKISGTGRGDLDANANIFCIRARKSSTFETVLLVDEDGDLWLDGTLVLGTTVLSETDLADLTDSGETTLHSHAGGGGDLLSDGSVDITGLTTSPWRILGTATQLNFGPSEAKGGFLISTADGQALMGAGLMYDGTNWKARHTSSFLLGIETSTGLVYTADSGHSVGDSITPTQILRVTPAGFMLLNETTNAMTIGITINQGAADDEILCFKSSDISHGAYGAEADTFGFIKKQDADEGGLSIRGYRDANTSDRGGLSLNSTVYGDVTTTQGSGGWKGSIELWALKASGAAETNQTADGVLVYMAIWRYYVR